MSFLPYSHYGQVNTNYGNYYYDGAYHFNSGNDNYLGNNYGNNPPSPEPHEEYDELLIQYATKHGITPQELYEANKECIHEQNEWE